MAGGKDSFSGFLWRVDSFCWSGFLFGFAVAGRLFLLVRIPFRAGFLLGFPVTGRLFLLVRIPFRVSCGGWTLSAGKDFF